MTLARNIALLIVALAGAWALLEAGLLLRDVRAHAVVTIENLDRNLIVLGVTLSEVQKGAKEWQIASKSQAANTSAAFSNVSAAAARFTTLVSRTDESLNSSLIPAISTTIKQQSDALTQNQTLFAANLTDLQSATKRLQKTLADADAQISSPAIGASLDNIQTSTANLNAGIVNLTGVTADAKKAADYELAQLEKPGKIWLDVLKFVLGYGSDARGLFVGFH